MKKRVGKIIRDGEAEKREKERCRGRDRERGGEREKIDREGNE